MVGEGDSRSDLSFIVSRSVGVVQHAVFFGDFHHGHDFSEDHHHNDFPSIGPKLSDEIHSDTNNSNYLDFPTGTDKHFELHPTNNNRVRYLLSKLCISKATRLDMISAKLLRGCSDFISHSLCEIFNQSIITGVFPDEWKCSKVIPLYK